MDMVRVSGKFKGLHAIAVTVFARFLQYAGKSGMNRQFYVFYFIFMCM